MAMTVVAAHGADAALGSEAHPEWMLRLRHRAKPSPAVSTEAPDWRLPPELVAASLEECLPALSSALGAAPTQPQNTTRRYVVLHMLCCRLSCQILERAVRARQQLGGAHRIVWSQFQELMAEDTNLWLLRALFRERVDLLTTRDLAKSFGGATFAEPGRMDTMWNRKRLREWSPHWVFCDWAYIAWFHRKGQKAMVQGTQGVWVMTYDVEWAGSLGRGLGELDDAPYDYIPGDHCRPSYPTWWWHGAHNFESRDYTWFSLVIVVRVSISLLTAVAREIQLGARAFCEVTTCTVVMTPPASRHVRGRNDTDQARPFSAALVEKPYTMAGLLQLQPGATSLQSFTCANCTGWRCSRKEVLETRPVGAYKLFHPCDDSRATMFVG